MKYKTVLLILMFSLLFSSCTAMDKAASLSESSINLISSLSVYETTTEIPEFDRLIQQNNKIDKDYNKDFYEGVSTSKEMEQVQIKYIEIWKKEMSDSIEKFKNLLADKDRKTFSEIQNEWETSMLDNLEFENSILNIDNSYQVNLGSTYHSLYLSEIRSSYRERTLRIKYLHYLLETKGLNNISEDVYESVQFSS